MSDQNRIDEFVGWAKTRLDEMAAAVKALQGQMDTMNDQVRAEAEQSIAKAQAWLRDCADQLSKVREQGETAVGDAQAHIERVWAEFEQEAAKWVELAQNQQQTFEAQANAQMQSWQGAVQEFMQRASQMQDAARVEVEAAVDRLKNDAAQAEGHLEELKKAGTASWDAMAKALDTSRAAFDKAAKEAREEFSKASKG